MYELCITYVGNYKDKLEYPILTDDNIYSIANADIFHMLYKNIIFLCIKMVHVKL